MATAEDYREAADAALRASDLELAIQQVSGAVALDPLNPETNSLVERLLAQLSDPVHQLDQEFYGTRAIQALALARAGRHAEALSRIGQVVVFRPDAPLLVWSARWFLELDPAELWPGVASTTADILDLLDGPAIRSRGLKENASAMARIVEHAAKYHEAAAKGLVVASARLWSRAGDRGRAQALLEEYHAKNPSLQTMTELALLARSRGDLRDARRWLREVLELHPEDIDSRLDLAETFAGLGHFEETVTELKALRALGTHSSDVDALQDYAEAMLSKSPAKRRALAQRAATDPKARQYYATLGAYEDVLVLPQDAVSNIVRDVMTKAAARPSTTPVLVKLSGGRPAPPSALVAFRLGLQRLRMRGELTVSAPPASRTSPIWRGSTDWLPSYGAPDEGIQREFQSVASLAFDASDWLSLTRDLKTLDQRSILGTMCNPSQLPGMHDPVESVFRLQLACAFALLHTSEGRATLHEIAGGLDDWSCSAALTALAAGARNQTVDPVELAHFIDAQLASSVGEGREHAVLVTRLSLPELDAPQAEALWERRSHLEWNFLETAWRFPASKGYA
ncbi:MAG: hypothetical protein R3B89_03560 [Polyangiaceae bacterium]